MYPKSPKTRSRLIFFFSIGLKILQNIISHTVLQKCFFFIWESTCHPERWRSRSNARILWNFELVCTKWGVLMKRQMQGLWEHQTLGKTWLNGKAREGIFWHAQQIMQHPYFCSWGIDFKLQPKPELIHSTSGGLKPSFLHGCNMQRGDHGREKPGA